MSLARARRNDSGFNYWPGFVDALSTLVLSIVFLLSVFLVVQFFLSQEVTGKDKALEQLNAKLAQLSELLSLEKLGKLNLDDQLSQLRAGLSSAEAAALVQRLAEEMNRDVIRLDHAIWRFESGRPVNQEGNPVEPDSDDPDDTTTPKTPTE